MSKKVYELAKELNVSSKILIDKIGKFLKIEAKNHMRTLEDEEVDAILKLFGVKKDIAEIPAKEVNIYETKKDEAQIKPEIIEKQDDIKEKVPQEIKDNKIQNEIKKQEPQKVEIVKNEIVEENNEDENIKLNEADEILIEEFLNNEDSTNKVEKIGNKAKQTKNVKFDKNVLIKEKKTNEEVSTIKSKKIIIPERITVKELAEKLGKPTNELIKKLLILGIMATINQEVDFDTASLISSEFGADVELEYIITDEEKLFNDFEDNEEDLQHRPPIVVVMGHVDHGKTSLLDAIRETHVIDKEAGGITQHIGAYSVHVHGKKITFLDTPGHEAFTAMRARGAQVTDIAVIVVAADDGIMPQTIEAIDHAKEAGVTIIVAINKIDKPGADPETVKQELTKYGLVVEDWGGDTIAVPVSAKKRENIDQLLEMILLVSDMHDLKANPNRLAKGTVIEAKLDKNRGAVATLLVQNGTLSVGDAIIAGTSFGRVRAMTDDKAQRVNKARPSTPVEILGLADVPKAGDLFYVVEDEKLAKQVAEKRRIVERESNIGSNSRVTLEDLFNQIQEGKVKDLNIIVKADVQGSFEAVRQSFNKLSNEEVRVRIIHGGVGAINESDVMLASASNAIIIGFNVKIESSISAIAEKEKVEVKLYDVIYKAIEDVEHAMKGMLDPEYKEVIIGHVEVRSLFKLSSVGIIAGCYVTDGKVVRNCEARIMRNNELVYQGKLSTLKRFKDDVKEVATNYECGLTLDKFNGIVEGDIIEFFEMQEIPR